jgi:anti-sigma factor RsiW
MKWRCALIQQRLPDYPDGDLSPFWKRQVVAHLEVCPDCRRELEEITEVVSLYQAHPLPDPGPAFWQDFQRELHLKLAQVNQVPEPAPGRWGLPYYLLGATAMAGILALAVYLGPFSRSSSQPQVAQRQEEAKTPKMAVRQEPPKTNLATSPAPEPAPPRAALATADKAETAAIQVAKPEAPPSGEPEYTLATGKLDPDRKAALDVERLLSEDDVLDWDVDSVVADLSREQQQHLKSKLESRR